MEDTRIKLHEYLEGFEELNRRRAGGGAPTAKEVVPILRRAAERRANDGVRILDIGCGMGGSVLMALEMLRNEGVHVQVKLLVALDPVENFVSRYKTAMSVLYPDAKIITIVDKYSDDIVSGEFDVILLIHSMYYLEVKSFFHLRENNLALGGEMCAIFNPETPVNHVRQYVGRGKKGGDFTAQMELLEVAKGNEDGGFEVSEYPVTEDVDMTDIVAGERNRNIDALVGFLLQTTQESIQQAERELCYEWIRKNVVEVGGSWKIPNPAFVVTWRAKQ